MEKKKGFLTIECKDGESIYLLANGERIRILVRRKGHYRIKVSVGASAERVKIFREKNWNENTGNGIRGVHRDKPDEGDPSDCL